MKNFVQKGDALDLTAPTGGVTAGVPVKINNLVVVSACDVDGGLPFAGYIRGVFDITAEGAESGQAFAEGETVYWDATNKRATKTATGNTAFGYAVAAKATADTVVRVVLVPGL